MNARFWTIGHPTGPAGEIIGALKECGIERVVDLRTTATGREAGVPDQDLADLLDGACIEYLHLPSLALPAEEAGQPVAHNRDQLTSAFHVYSSQRSAEVAALEDFIEERRTALLCTEVAHGTCGGSVLVEMLQMRGHPVEHL